MTIDVTGYYHSSASWEVLWVEILASIVTGSTSYWWDVNINKAGGAVVAVHRTGLPFGSCIIRGRNFILIHCKV
jgi:hypothetical protein